MPWCLIAALTAIGVTDELAPYRGQPVLSVEVDAPEEEDPSSLRKLINIRPGYLLTTLDLQAAIKRLYALGRFSNVRVVAKRLSGVVTLRFELQPVRRLASIQVTGLDHGDPDALIAALRMNIGAEVDRRTGEILAQRARQTLHRAGFPEAAVGVTMVSSPGSPNELTVRLNVEEGFPLRVYEVAFVGSPRVSNDVLKGIVRTQPGDIVDLDRIKLDTQNLHKAYVQRGFLRVRVDEPTIHFDLGKIILRFRILAGDRIHIDIVGNKSVTTDTVMTLWPESSPAIRAGSLDRFSRAIVERYRRHAYADARVDLRGYYDSQRQVLRYLYTIDEGEPVRVVKLVFEGAESILPDVLIGHVRAVLRDNLSVLDDFKQMSRAELISAQDGNRLYGENKPRQNFAETVPPEERWVSELYEQALAEIVAVYRDRGFLEAKVSAPETSREGSEMVVRVMVEEGLQTTIGSIRFRGNEAMPSTEVLAELERLTRSDPDATPISLGGPYSAGSLEEGRIAVVRRYRNQGYLYARLFLTVALRDQGRFADVVYRFEEGPQVHIQGVILRGNEHTDEELIRSRMTLHEGTVYRLSYALQDQRSLANLGIFSSVRVKLIDEEEPEEYKDLVAEIVEGPRHAFELSGGLSTADGIRLGAHYSHKNFFGNATTLDMFAKFNRQILFSLYGEYSETMETRYADYDNFGEQLTKALERDIRFGVRSRRLTLFPVPTALRLDLTNERENAIPFSLDETALTFGVELFPVDRVRLTLEPQLAITNLECSVDATQCLFDARDQNRRVIDEGLRRAFRIGPTFTVDLRDNPLAPRSGLWANAKSQYVVGTARENEEDDFSDFSFARLEGRLIAYIPIWKPVLVISGRLGLIYSIGGDIPIDERFFLGGRDSLRGFVENTMIPDDVCVWLDSEIPPSEVEVAARRARENCSQVLTHESAESPPVTQGGNFFANARSELRVPVTENWTLDLFVDAGNLWVERPDKRALRLRIGIGAGIRYNTAIGALVVDVALNPDPRVENGERAFPPQFHLSLTTF